MSSLFFDAELVRTYELSGGKETDADPIELVPSEIPKQPRESHDPLVAEFLEDYLFSLILLSVSCCVVVLLNAQQLPKPDTLDWVSTLVLWLPLSALLFSLLLIACSNWSRSERARDPA